MSHPLRNAIYKVVESKPFELGIMAMIMLNVVVMAARVFDASKAHHDVLVALNYVFIIISTIICESGGHVIFSRNSEDSMKFVGEAMREMERQSLLTN